MNKRPQHKQIPVKVTTFVDEGIAEVIKALNDIDKISTFSSCQGIVGREYAHVYFDYGQSPPSSWLELAHLASRLAKLLSAHNIYDADVSLQWTGDKDNPFIAIEFDPRYTSQIAKILNDHKSELVYGT